MSGFIALLLPVLALAAPAPDAGHADAGRPDAAVAERPDAGAKAEPAAETVPPALTMGALCAELSRASRSQAEQQAAMAKEREALAKERADLEKLAKDVEAARTQLREETDKLASFVELAGEDLKPGGARYWPTRLAQMSDPKTNGGKNQLDTLAKTVKAMKPEQAAILVARLDKNLGAALLSRMKPADASSVMDRLKPEQAAELFGLMAAAGKPGPKEPTK